MKSDTKKFVDALDHGGIPLVLREVINQERADPYTATQFLSRHYLTIGNEILPALMEIPEWVFRGIITLSDYREEHCVQVLSRIPILLLDVTGDSQTTGTHSQLSRNLSEQEYIVEAILDSKICGPEDDLDYTGSVIYEIKWQGYEDENTWEPYDNCKCPVKIQEFHRQHPEKPRYGPDDRQIILDLDDITLVGEDGQEQHIIYAHWLVDDTDTSTAWLSPTTNELLHIIERLELYASDFPRNHPRYHEQLEYIRKIDFLPPSTSYNIAQNWYLENFNAGHRRYLHSTAANGISAQRQTIWLTQLIPAMRQEFLAIPEAERDLPYPHPLSEIGYTSRPQKRKEEHAAHKSSCVSMYAIGAIAIHEYDAKYGWIYQPIASVRTFPQGRGLECFFSRLCQSYSWLGGGVNTEIAGKAMAPSLHKLSTKEAWDLTATLNTTIMQQNSEIAHNRLEESIHKCQLKSKISQLQTMNVAGRKEIEELQLRADTVLRPELAELIKWKHSFFREMKKTLAVRMENQKALADLEKTRELLEKLVVAEEKLNQRMGI